MTTDLSLTERAARIAATAHKEDVRKSDGSPYIVHPFMVAWKLREHGFSDEVVAAALVHDVLEDTSYSSDILETLLGSAVLNIVRAVSEDKSLVWEERKRAYAAQVASGGMEALAVSLADKIHNLTGMVAGLKAGGSAFWSHFNRGKEKQLWFAELMLETYRTHLTHPLVDEYAALVEELKTLG